MIRKKRAISASQAKALDIRAKEKFGIQTLLLMENAGRAVCDEVIRIARDRNIALAIFCGKGNNGGDGFCAARHLLTKGFRPQVFLAGSIKEVGNEARQNLEILLRLGQRVFEVREGNLAAIQKKISRHHFIIDALLGVGVRGQVRGVYRELINLINSSGAFVLAVDLPSGLDADTGSPLGSCVKADRTVTFVAKKKAMVKQRGAGYCGKITVADIGIPL